MSSYFCAINYFSCMKFFVFSLVLVFLTLPAFSQKESGDKEYWKNRYLSVSLPLRRDIYVTSPYGYRKSPFTGKRALHSGLDLRARYEEVLAMFDGEVTDMGRDNRSGIYLKLRHGLYEVSYCHLSEIWVEVGEQVKAGDVVGKTGNTGKSTGPHLHITSKYKGERRDPYTLILYIQDVRREAIVALGGKSVLVDVRFPVNEKSGREQFLSRYASIAIVHQQKYGIPASVTLSQMAYESDWGRSTLAREANNYFGIKCSSSWLAERKPYMLRDDDAKNEKFCVYEDVGESLEHHARLLTSDRYRRCQRYGPTDYHNWLVGIKRSGYATAPNYVSEMEKIIRQYKLYLYDREGLS